MNWEQHVMFFLAGLGKAVCVAIFGIIVIPLMIVVWVWSVLQFVYWQGRGMPGRCPDEWALVDRVMDLLVSPAVSELKAKKGIGQSDD